jgi:hypothetical protein
MPCSITVNGRLFPCKSAIGGVKQVWIDEWVDGYWEDPTSGNVADSAAAQTLKNYEIAKNSGSFQQTVTSSIDNGTVFYSQVLEITLPVLSATFSEEVADLLKSRLTIVVQDNNDNYFVMGLKHGAEGSGGVIGTGAAKGDLSGYQLQFTAEEALPAPTVTRAAAGADLTWTLATA